MRPRHPLATRVAPPTRPRRLRGEASVQAFEYAAAAALAVWLVVVMVGALDQMLEPPPVIIIGPDGEDWQP